MSYHRPFGLLERELKRLPSRGPTKYIPAFDGQSTLYVVTSEGDVLGADVRKEVTSENAAPSLGKTRESDSHSKRDLSFLRPQPELQPCVSHFEISNDGRFAVVAGPSCVDAELYAIAILDLRAAKAVPGREASAHSAPVAADLFSKRPGLRILQVSWHPDSAKHFGVLSSDDTFRLFCLDDLQLAEQTFHLELRERGGLGLNAEESGRAVAFAFSQGSLWQSFTVYFLTLSGGIYLLCPVAPFRSRVQQSLAAELQDNTRSENEEAMSATTMAWLQQAFGVEAKAAMSPNQATADDETVLVQPHALREHTPLLQGPLPVTCPDAELLGLSGLSSSQRTVAVSWIRCRGECAFLCVATAQGLVGWHLVAHAPEPDWADCCPNCVVSDSRIIAVHSQVPKSEGCASELLLLAAAQVGSTQAREAEEFWEGTALFKLLNDPLHPDHIFCVHANGAYLLVAPWILKLAGKLGSTGELFEGQQIDMGSTTVEELWTALDSGPSCTGAAVVSNALAGTALVLATSDGCMPCLRPAAISQPLQEAAVARSLTAESEVTAAELKAKYGDMLRGPRNVAMPQIVPAGAAQPEGLRLLIASITALKAKHVQYIVQSHNKLLPELEQVLASAESEESRVRQVERVATALDKRGQPISERLDKALRWNDNLNARVKLLAELHWSLPHPLSSAETQFCNQELPNLEMEVQQLKESIQQLGRRAGALVQARPKQLSSAISIPPTQVRNLRAALAQQADLSEVAQGLAGKIEAQLRRLEAASSSGLLAL